VQHSRNRDLDGVRGLAILLVVAAHSGLPVRWGGLSGVTLFFVLSGYLITSLLVREWDRWGSVSLWRFWGRRALRLLPALVLLLVLAPLLLWATGDDRLSTYPTAALASLFYVGNWVRIGGTDLGVLNHLWSLSVEEQFYVVWPLAFIVLFRWFRSHALQVVIAVALVASFFRAWTQDTSDIATSANAFSLLLGVALSLGLAGAARRGWTLPHAHPLIPFVLLVVLSAFPGHTPIVDQSLFRPLAVLFAAGGVWLVYAAVSGHSRVVGSRVMVFFGTISYALYLWHQTFINSRLLGEHATPRNLVLIAAAVLVSWLSWVLVERPVGRLRGRLRLDQPSRRQRAFAETRDQAARDPRPAAPTA
jgi:peptidoglycan/LPS O-acetylase OafA/YrhL